MWLEMSPSFVPLQAFTEPEKPTDLLVFCRRSFFTRKPVLEAKLGLWFPEVWILRLCPPGYDNFLPSSLEI